MKGTKLKLSEEGIHQLAGDNLKRIEKWKAKRFEYRSISTTYPGCITVKDEKGYYEIFHEDFLEIAS